MNELIILAGIATLTSVITALAGLGGGMLLLALMAQIFPPAILIPLHGIAQCFSNASRGILFRKGIQKAYLLPFLLGSLVGAALIAPFVVFIPATVGALLLGVFVLLTTWFPNQLSAEKLPSWLSGAVTSGLGVVFGAVGPMVMSALPKQHWSKEEITGTYGVATAFQHGFKVLAYIAVGVQLNDYLAHIVVLFVGAWVGTLIGARLLMQVSEVGFKRLLKWVLTLLGIRLVLINAWSLLA